MRLLAATSGSLRAERNFVRLWSGQTVSVFGSLLTHVAIPFVAIIELDASAGDIAVLRIAATVSAFFAGFIAGLIVDRLRRKSLMIGTDFVRAGVVILIPVAFLFDQLSMPLLVTVISVAGGLGVVFDVAYQSFLPSLVGRKHIVEANSKMTASSSVAEFFAFASGGWFVQLLTAPFALVIDALTFLVSAFFLKRIDADEVVASDRTEPPEVSSLFAGFRRVAADPRLRALAMVTICLSLAQSIFGVAFLLYVIEDLGFRPGLLGVIFGLGGVASLLGALRAAPVLLRYGIKNTLILGMLIIAGGQALIPLSPEFGVVAIVLLVLQQFTIDPAWTIAEIAGVSYRQDVTPEDWLGRVNAVFRVLEFGSLLVGTGIGAWVASVYGLHLALWFAVAAPLIAIPFLQRGFMPADQTSSA